MGHARLIRPATPDDLPAIEALHLASWQETYADLMPPDFLRDEAPRYLAQKWAAIPDGTLLVSARDDDIEGFTLIDSARPAYLDALHVAALARGAGLGHELIRTAFTAAAGQGAKGAWLYILEGNEAAERFYKRLGAVETWRGPDPDHGAGIIAIRLDWFDFSSMLASPDPN